MLKTDLFPVQWWRVGGGGNQGVARMWDCRV